MIFYRDNIQQSSLIDFNGSINGSGKNEARQDPHTPGGNEEREGDEGHVYKVNESWEENGDIPTSIEEPEAVEP